MNYPSIPTQYSGALSRYVSSGHETISGQIDNIKLPYEEELLKYVNVDDNDVKTFITNLKSILGNLKALSPAYGSYVLAVNDFDDAFSSSLLTSLNTAVANNLADTGTGWNITAETAMFERARARRRAEASRTARRINIVESSKIPYSGMVIDKLHEADQDNIKAMEELEWHITEKQADMSYQYYRDKIKEAMAQVEIQKNITDTQLDRTLKATLSLDEMKRADHWNKFEYYLKQYLTYLKETTEFIYRIGIGVDQLTFENWRSLCSIMAEGQLRIAALVTDLFPSTSTLE